MFELEFPLGYLLGFLLELVFGLMLVFGLEFQLGLEFESVFVKMC